MASNRRARFIVPAFCTFVLGSSRFVTAQVPLNLPQASPAARAAQTIGTTEIEIIYHRPAVNGRKIWGGLVPYNEVWRAGANENTTIRFTTPVSVEGKPLAAGTYGLHMVPGEKEWTIAFSTVSSAWGSFSYDAKEDALRVTVSPRPADFEERLSYRFDDPTDKSATVTLHWEKLAVPFKIEVDTPSLTVASIRAQMRGLPRFSWQGWNQAAAYCLGAGVNLEEARQWADRSVQMNENFQNLRTKAGLVEKAGDAKTAEELRARAFKVATENDLNLYGYQLLNESKMDEAVAIFQRNTREHPQSWNTWDSLGDGYDRQGNKKAAIENYSKALSMAPESQKKRIQDTLARLKGTPA